MKHSTKDWRLSSTDDHTDNSVENHLQPTNDLYNAITGVVNFDLSA